MSQAQLIERDGIKSLFRIPGFMPRYGGMSADNEKKAGKFRAKTESSFQPGAVSKTEQAIKEPGEEKYAPISDGYENLESAHDAHQQLWYLFKFSHFMRLWMPFDTYCKFTMSLGIVALGHGTTYFVVSKIGLHKLRYFFSLVCMISPFMYFPMVVVADNFQFPNRKYFFFGMALQLAGPIFGVMAVFSRGRHPYSIVENLCVPLSFFFHALFYAAVFTVSYSKADDGRLPGIDRDDDLLTDVIQDLTYAMEVVTAEKDGAKRPDVDGNEGNVSHYDEQGEQHIGWESGAKYQDATKPESSAPNFMSAPTFKGSVSQKGWPTDSPEFEQQAKALSKTVKGSLRKALMVAVGMYMILTTRCCVKILDKTVWRRVVPVPAPMAVVSKEFPVIWSSTPFFIPHALACSKRSIFLADRFHVFELENGENLRELCKFNQPILDVIGYCDDHGKSCRPVVLFRKGGKRNNVVEFHDCIKGNHTSELKQALGELGHAGTYFRRDNGVATRLLVTTHQDVLLQSRL
jgi:hypothetical protein